MELIYKLIKELEDASDAQLIFLRYLIDSELSSRKIFIKKTKKNKKKEG